MDCSSLLEGKVTHCYISTMALTVYHKVMQTHVTVVHRSELKFAKKNKSFGPEDLSVVRAEEFDYPLQLLALKLYPVNPCTSLTPPPHASVLGALTV